MKWVKLVYQLSKQKLLEVGVERLKKKKRDDGVTSEAWNIRGRKTYFCFKCLDDAAVFTELEMKYPRRTVGKKAFMPDLYVQHMLFVYSLQMKGARVASLVMHWLGKWRVLVCMLERSLRYGVKDPTRPLTGGWHFVVDTEPVSGFTNQSLPGAETLLTFHSIPTWFEVLRIESGTPPSISNMANINSNYWWQPTAAGQTG